MIRVGDHILINKGVYKNYNAFVRKKLKGGRIEVFIMNLNIVKVVYESNVGIY